MKMREAAWEAAQLLEGWLPRTLCFPKAPGSQTEEHSDRSSSCKAGPPSLVDGMEEASLGVLCRAVVQLLSDCCWAAGNHGFLRKSQCSRCLFHLAGTAGGSLPVPGAGNCLCWGRAWVSPPRRVPSPLPPRSIPVLGCCPPLPQGKCGSHLGSPSPPAGQGVR